MTNVNRYFLALSHQVAGDTKAALAMMENVEPMQPADSSALIMLILVSKHRAELLDLLVNSAIVGMADNRETPDETAGDIAALLFMRDIACQKKAQN
jgi:hypothetical protein